MSATRTLSVASALTLLLLLAACGGAGGSKDEEARVEADLRLVRQTLSDVYPRLASATGDTSTENAATLATTSCGLASISTGVTASASFALRMPTMRGERLGLAIARALRSDGWTVPTVGADALQATRGRLTLSASYANLVTLDLSSACVATSDDVAEDFGRRPPRDVELNRGR